jgi:hypothetical protein
LIKGEKDVVRKEAGDRIAVAQTRRNKEIESAKPLLESWGGDEDYNKSVEQAKAKEEKESNNARWVQKKKLSDIDKKYAKELNTLSSIINSARKDSKSRTVNVDKKVNSLEKNIEQEQNKVELVREDKMVFEKEYRKLEAEVGPIKYIAEFVYGESADKNMLEKAVTWVIMMIIFVFDPLAVGLLIASQYAFAFGGRSTKPLDTEEEKISVLDNSKTKIIERTYEVEVEADVDDTTPEDIQKLEEQIDNKLEK